MGKIESVLKSEIVRLAAKEIRSLCGPTVRDVRRLKRTVSQLSKTVATLEKAARRWTEETQERKAELRVPEKEAEAARLSAGLIRKLRTRLGLSQAELATLVGVSTISVGLWEHGKTRPSGENRGALVALRKLGKRDVRKMLDRKTEPKPQKRTRKATVKPARRTRRKK